MINFRQMLRYLLLFIGSSSALLLVVTGFAKIEAYYHSGKVDNSAHPGFSLLQENVPIIAWKSTNELQANAYIKDEISKDYANAWMWLNSSIASEDWRGIEDYFTQDFSDQITTTSVSYSIPLEQTILEHNLDLLHLSNDYTVAVLSDSLLFYRESEITAEKSLEELKTINMEIHLILQDGRWKIFNWIMLENEIVNAEQGYQKKKLLTENLESVKSIKGINYYPQKSPWLEFWPNYDHQIIEEDLQKINTLNFNTVRIFLNMDAFGRGEIDRNTVEKLDHFIATAEKNELRVLPTLFDFPIGYGIEKLPIYYRQLKFLISRYRNNPTIIAWNLKNELDLDFELHGESKVLSWARLMLDTYRSIDNIHPITIGWAYPENMVVLSKEVDYISIHHYGGIDELRANLQKNSELDKPIVIEEFGKPSNTHFLNFFRDSEKKQTRDILEKISFYQEVQLPWLLWTLYDFDRAPKEVFGMNPSLRHSQKGFGILETNGNAKEIAQELEHTLSR